MFFDFVWCFWNWLKITIISINLAIFGPALNIIFSVIYLGKTNLKILQAWSQTAWGYQFVNPLQDLLQDPLQNPLQNPLQDPLQDPLEDPLQDPLQDPIQDPKLWLLAVIVSCVENCSRVELISTFTQSQSNLG